jgi:hypothetical protein
MSHIKEFFKTAWRWQKGRQLSGYDKMLLLWGLLPLPFDIYLIRYRVGSYIKPHVDQVKSGRHFRLNVILKQSKEGGDFVCDNCIINTKRIKLFRPDLNEHSVTEVKQGNRYILSVGWVRK